MSSGDDHDPGPDPNYFDGDGRPLEHPAEDETVDASSRVRRWPAPEESPVIPLGYVRNQVAFVMPEGDVRLEPAKAIPQLLKVDIYVSRDGAAFLQNFMGGDGEGGKRFLRDAAATWFVRHCRDAGQFDPSRRQRKIGVWPIGPLGEGLALHLGDEIWVPRPAEGAGGKPAWARKSVFETFKADRTGPMWVLAPPTPRPDQPCSRSDGLEVLAKIGWWRFESIGDDLDGADIVAGWIMAALLGAVPWFRVHLLIFAMKSSGKTTLMRFIHALMRVLVEEPITAFTEPGLRKALEDEAHAVLIDEAETGMQFGDGPSLIDRALEVLRPMSTGDGGNRKMGDVAGGQKTQTAQGSALLAATKPPRLNPADASRFVEVKLLTLKASGQDGARTGADAYRPKTDAEISKAIEWARALAPGLLGRAVHGAGRYRQDYAAVKAAIVETLGEDPRTGDLVATLAAGRRLLLYDAPLTPDEVKGELARFRPLLEQRAETEHVSNDGADLLDHLLRFNSGQHHGDRFLTIGELIEKRIEDPGHLGYAKSLAVHGLRVELAGGELSTEGDVVDGDWLLVANGHPGMKAIVRGTDYGDWRRTLTYLEDLGPEHGQLKVRPLRFGPGPQKRSLAIPLAPWFERAIPSRRHDPRYRSGPVPADRSGFGVEDV